MRTTTTTPVARKQWQNVKDRSTVSGKLIFYAVIASLFLVYSVVLVKIAVDMNRDTTKNAIVRGGGGGGGTGAAGAHEPKNLMTDDGVGMVPRNEWGPFDDFIGPDGEGYDGLETTQFNCSWPGILSGGKTTDANTPKRKEEKEAKAEAEAEDVIPISEADKDGCYKDRTKRAVGCIFHQLTIDTTKIHMTAAGGEELDAVMGQDEVDEFVQSYDVGAFTHPKGVTVPSIADLTFSEVNYDGSENLFYLKPALASMKERGYLDGIGEGGWCTPQNIVTTPTLFIGRYEYVNLKSTVSDLFNAYGVSYGGGGGVKNGSEEEMQRFDVVFLDGHPRGDLDSIWSKVFGGTVRHVKTLSPPTACYEKAVFVPAGYMSPLQSIHCTAVPAMMTPFVEHILRRYGMTDSKRTKKRVLIVDRVGYISHPRSHPDAMQRTLDNLSDLRDAIAAAIPGVDVTLFRPELMTFEKQLETVRDAEVLIGKFGSGLSNLLFMDEDTLSIELDAESYNLYSGFADWKGKNYHAHVQIVTNTETPGFGGGDTDEKRSRVLDRRSIDQIVDLVKTKVHCNLWDGNVVTAMFNEVRCEKKKNVRERAMMRR